MEKALLEKISALANEIKNDAHFTAYADAGEKYHGDEQTKRNIAEYEALQEALAAEYTKDELDTAAADSIQARIDELYSLLTKSDTYRQYSRAAHEYEDFISEVYAELEFAITGKRPCTHDCSSCGGCH